MDHITIKLTKPIETHEGPKSEIRLRPPKYKDVMRLGEVQIWARSAEGALMPVENSVAVEGYIEACADSMDPLLLKQLALPDTLAVKDTIMGFFREARAIQPAPQGSSSSSSDKA